VSIRLTPEFAGDNASLLDFWIDLALTPSTTLRLGQMKSPVSLERLMSAASLPLIERSFGSELAGNRDIGVQLQGSLADARVNYSIGLFNGAVDGRNAASHNPDDEFELAGRIIFEPWRETRSLFADPAAAVESARSWAVGINWYLSSNLKASANYQSTRFDGGAAASSNRIREEALLSRLQVAF